MGSEVAADIVVVASRVETRVWENMRKKDDKPGEIVAPKGLM